MTTSYNTSIDTDTDWVRMKIGDTGTFGFALQDETIQAVLREAPNKYTAAAACGRAALGVWLSRGQGIAEKQVERLRIKYSEGRSILEAYNEQVLKKLEEEGAKLMLGSTHVFKVL